MAIILLISLVSIVPLILGIIAARIEKEDGRNHFGGRIKSTPKEQFVAEIVAVLMTTGFSVYAGVKQSNDLFFLFAAAIFGVGVLLIWLRRSGNPSE